MIFHTVTKREHYNTRNIWTENLTEQIIKLALWIKYRYLRNQITSATLYEGYGKGSKLNVQRKNMEAGHKRRDATTLHQRKEKGKDIKREKIMIIWSFKRKRHLNTTLNKHKARLCCYGGQQQW